jgi:hypothetical protein
MTNPTPPATTGAKVPKRIRISPLEDTRGAIRGECHVYEDKGDDGTGNPVYVLEEPRVTDAKMPPMDGFGSTAYGGKDFPKLFVRRDIEFHTKEIQAKTVPDEEFCVEYLPQHDAVAVAKRLESAVSQERARTLRAVEALWNEWCEDRGVFGSCLGEMVHNANAKAPVEPAKAAGSPNGAGEMS